MKATGKKVDFTPTRQRPANLAKETITPSRNHKLPGLSIFMSGSKSSVKKLNRGNSNNRRVDQRDRREQNRDLYFPDSPLKISKISNPHERSENADPNYVNSKNALLMQISTPKPLSRKLKLKPAKVTLKTQNTMTDSGEFSKSTTGKQRSYTQNLGMRLRN